MDLSLNLFASLELLAADAAAKGIDWSWWWNLTQGILALGMVILIHEFGHFAAAKLCGVKVEKFYIGFDFFGLRIARFKWGETEYGIGLIPLGGYVYMLGQTDNPAKQAEEAERAKAAAAKGEAIDPAVAAEAAAVWDPRSYPAQSVPERMFIISAGVIMNTITAFLFAIWAYNLGVEHTPAAVGEVSAGGAAWDAGLRAGDEFTNVDGILHPRFESDLRSRAVLADMRRGLPVTIRRDGKEFDLTIMPKKLRSDLPPTLGIGGPRLSKLASLVDGKPPAIEHTAARAAEPPFADGDRIVKIGDRAVKNFTEIQEALVAQADKKLPIVVERRAKDAAATEKPQELTIEVSPQPWRTLGMTMEMQPISGVQKDSPAAGAGLQAGDKLVSIDGEPPGDPVMLPERMRRKQVADPAATWKLVVERGAETKTIDVKPRAADFEETPLIPGSPLSIPTLGVAYQIGTKVAAVEADGPAAKAGVKAGDVFTQLKTVPTDEPQQDSGKAPKSATLELTGDDLNDWAFVATALLQSLRPTTKLELKTADDRTLTLQPADAPGFFQPDRGFIFESTREERKATSLAEAVNFAWYDTRDSMTQVYRFLHALWIKQIPASSLGGVITIADQASVSAARGFPQLLLFVMMLSCNLAVLNFLPFPVLDGGHMVFLIYEGIFRRPPPERLVIALNLLGLVCLLGLMLFALTMDITRLVK